MTSLDHRPTLLHAPFAIAFGGQGAEWLAPLDRLVRDFVIGEHVGRLVVDADARLADLARDLAPAAAFSPLAWLDALATEESVAADLLTPAVSVPGITLTQLAGIEALDRLGIDAGEATAVVGHSQGVLAAEALAGRDPVDVLVAARLVGGAAEIVARRRGLLGAGTMVSLQGLTMAEATAALAGTRVVPALRNARRSVVLAGPAAEVARVVDVIERAHDGVVVEPVASRLAFHHPDLAESIDLASVWAHRAGLDPTWVRDVARRAILDPVDWVETLGAIDADWLVDLGPADLASRLSAGELRSRGIGVIAPLTREGHRALTVVGAEARRPRPWSDHAPRIVSLPDGRIVAETAFTRLTGKSPILLAGMTPTTVDAGIVAAAANAGFWSELAGGGQVTPEIFAARIAELDTLLDPGATFQFNALYLDPYLWKLQLGGQRLVQKARAAGAPLDGVIVTAGIPELDEAVALVGELRDLGISHVVFKPGTVAQIAQVLAIAREVAPIPVIVQIEGGKAGGHHSWEDLDALVLATYADLRAADNVVVCVGGGIGTPEAAAQWLTGEWALRHDHPLMPVDGILVGTAAMATAEATTSPQVKRLLVETPGTQGWVESGTASGGMASSRSQLGADIHEIDNAASRAGRLLDEVAGDAAAVAERRDEIIEALSRTAKPYFGDVAEFTYARLLERFAHLTFHESWDGWLDVTMSDRFVELLQRAEARLAPQDRGQVPTRFAGSVADPLAAIATLVEVHPGAADVRLHPADVQFFVDVCRRPGKPVPFVPVIDGEVRRWWRSDSLWQAHDARYSADEVCIIPGPTSVAGITRVDEPVATLLTRFEDATIDAVLTSGLSPCPVAGRRRTADADRAVALVLASPDVVWAGRTVMNPVARLEAYDLVALDDHTAELRVDLGDRTFTLRIDVPAWVGLGGLPIVTAESAAAATRALVEAGPASTTLAWHPDLVADHAAVVGTGSGAEVPAHPAPDVLVGLAWPAVFGILASTDGPDGLPLVEGLLDLVHLDHHVVGAVPVHPESLSVEASLVSIADTDLGRVVTIDVRVGATRMTERFCIRGRSGTATLADPAPVAVDVLPTPRRGRVRTQLTAPADARAFALVTGDHNPIHTSDAAARLAGLGAPIVHGMWTSAAAQYAVATTTGRRISAWTARFLAPVRPGAPVEVRADRTGLIDGAEVLDVTVRADDQVVMSASARLEPPRTAYVFPGQGIQSVGMGMDGYRRCPAAREVWDRADRHTREALGFSILTVVRDNPTSLTVRGTTHSHPDGVLFLTQFTQVAMAVLGAAQMAELREAGAVVDGAILAGHSVGEYNALAAVSGVIPLEAVVEVVFQRGTVMHSLVPRDTRGRSNYRLAAIRPSQLDLADDDVRPFVEAVAERTGEFLQIVNYNLRGSQYAIAGTIAGLDALSEAVEERRAAAGGKAAFILVPGIDVPFHSSVLHGGVPDFRDRLDELLPPTIDPAILEGRYVPNLVARPFALTEEFIGAIESLVDTRIERHEDPRVLCRAVLIELLAWQFASPVRWIETQDLMFTPVERGGLGVERLVEIGVGSAPTIANLAAGTLKLPGYAPVEVLNVERDAPVVFGTDEDPLVDDEPVAEATDAPASTAAPAAPPAVPTGGATQDAPDLPFAASDATRVLLAWWTKVRPDQLGASDSIEALTDGASSRRNQILMDLGTELALGAIDGAAEADLTTLAATVDGLARSYKPFGPVLSATFADHLKKVLGPAGAKTAAIADRVSSAWQLSSGWVHHVTAEVALASRDGASVRGGDLATVPTPASKADVESLVDAAILAVAGRHGLSVHLPSAGGAEATVDAAAMAAATEAITGPDGVLAAIADTIRTRLGLLDEVTVDSPDDTGDDHVSSELGPDWQRATTPVFDARRAVVLDDRWASAREDLARGRRDLESYRGTGPVLAAQARWWAGSTGDTFFEQVAEVALDETPGAFADQVAVITGAGRGSIAGAVAGRLLAEGATVIATTSSLGRDKLTWFTDLYRGHARGGAVLWVVPVNVASFADLDAFTDWIGQERTRTAAGVTTVVKPAYTPTLLLPFAAGRVVGDASDAGSRAETEMRILLWSVERLVGRLAEKVTDRDLDARLHVVLPGSPNRGTFGGDGAYGEAKAALDALVAKWHAERSWADKVTLVHALIGWVRGTGLMGGNDPLVGAVEAAGVRTWSSDEMAAELIGACTPEARADASTAPVTLDLTGGLAGVDLRSLTPADTAQEEGSTAEGSAPEDDAGQATIAALPPSPFALDTVEVPQWGEVTTSLDDMVVIVGTGELGPLGSARTRWEVEVEDRLSAAGILELAWLTGLVTWDNGWIDAASGDEVAEADLADRYEEQVRERIGIRRYADDAGMVDNTAPLLVSVYLDHDLTFTVSSEAEARAMAAADPDHTRIREHDGEWTVVRTAGSQVRVPRRTTLTRTVGGQIPTGFDPTRWGIPAEMVQALDRVAVWNLVCTVDAFLSAGFTPADLLRWVHPALVANTQGTGMGGMTSMRSLYLDTLLGEPKPNDILQEALPNVIAAHVMQSYVGGYGAMVHPVAACATTAVSVEEGVDKIRLGKAEFVVAGGFDDLSIEGIVGFGDMSATADTAAMTEQGIEERFVSRANDRRYGGFVESQGGGTILLARASLAAEHGLAVLGVVAHASSHADGVHTSIPAPGLGALGAAHGGRSSALATSLAGLGVGADDIAVVSKHDTSTGVNERNESELHERLAGAIGRTAGNPLYVISQKTLTGHAKGGAAAFQLTGLCQVLADGVVPPNRSLDCVMDDLADHEHLVWLREPLLTGPLKAGLLTSLGFGHVAGIIAVVHPQAFVRALQNAGLDADAWSERAQQRTLAGRARLVEAMYGGPALYERPSRTIEREDEAALLLGS